MNSVATRKVTPQHDGTVLLDITFTNGDRRQFARRGTAWTEWVERTRTTVNITLHTQLWCSKQELAATAGR